MKECNINQSLPHLEKIRRKKLAIDALKMVIRIINSKNMSSSIKAAIVNAYAASDFLYKQTFTLRSLKAFQCRYITHITGVKWVKHEMA